MRLKMVSLMLSEKQFEQIKKFGAVLEKYQRRAALRPSGYGH